MADQNYGVSALEWNYIYGAVTLSRSVVTHHSDIVFSVP